MQRDQVLDSKIASTANQGWKISPEPWSWKVMTFTGTWEAVMWKLRSWWRSEHALKTELTNEAESHPTTRPGPAWVDNPLQKERGMIDSYKKQLQKDQRTRWFLKSAIGSLRLEGLGKEGNKREVPDLVDLMTLETDQSASKTAWLQRKLPTPDPILLSHQNTFTTVLLSCRTM